MLLICPECGDFMSFHPCRTIIDSRTLNDGDFICQRCGMDISVVDEEVRE